MPSPAKPMSKAIAWNRRIGVRLGGVTLLLLAVSLVLVVGNYYTLASMQGDAASLSLFGKGRMQLYQLLYLAHYVAVEHNDASPQTRTELEDMDKAFEDRFRQLEKGDPAQGVPAATDPIILNEIHERNRPGKRSSSRSSITSSRRPRRKRPPRTCPNWTPSSARVLRRLRKALPSTRRSWPPAHCASTCCCSSSPWSCWRPPAWCCGPD